MEHLTVKQLPSQLRPYERCVKEGPSVLNDAELLAVIMKNGLPGENSVQMCTRLLQEADFPSLAAMSIPQLKKIRGIGTVKAVQLQCLGELAKRFSKSSFGEETAFHQPDQIATYLMERMCHEKRESVIVLFLNNKNRLIHESMLTKGTVNASLISPREIFLEALHYEAVFVILAHNHPSGDPTPSQEDIRMTRQVYKAGELLSVPLLDHIIIGNHRYTSLRERGLIQ